MATVHTAYGPGKIVDQETVRGRTQYKVAGDGFEVWLDETKIASLDDEFASPVTPGGWMEDDYRHTPLLEEEFPEHPLVENPGLGREFQRRRDLDDDDFDERELRHSHRHAWAPLDKDNSTTLPYNPDPQHDARGFSGDDGSSTLQPIHHIDPDERLDDANSITFDDEDGGEEPGPNPDLFAKEGAIPPSAIRHPKVFPHLKFLLGPAAAEAAVAGLENTTVGHGLNAVQNTVDGVVDKFAPGPGWGELIKGGSLHEANPALLLPLLGIGAEGAGAAAAGAAARAAGGAALHGLMSKGAEAAENFGPGESEDGWGDLIKDSSYRPAGLSDKYIDITAGADYHNDPVAQFRHDPDAYINRIGHLYDEGLNPRFAEYMDLVEADGSVRTAAWKDVRKKAMRLKREGHVTVKDIAPNRIMASVVGDHGTYDVLILKSGSFGGLNDGMPGHSISNWHCGCEWGRWAFRRKFTYVGRLCSHAYASYLTMQSAAMKGKPRQPKLEKGKKPSRSLPYVFVKRSDALQNGPERLTPEMMVNDTDDAQMFMDVTKDERNDVGPDDVMSEKDIVHFARLMRHCEATEQPYPRQLVAFLARYAKEADDTQNDYEAPHTEDAEGALNRIRDFGNRKQEDDFGDMADRVHKIQDAVEEARDNGVDASQFVASVRKMAEDPKYKNIQDGGRAVTRGPDNRGYAQDGTTINRVNFDGKGTQGPKGNYYDIDPSGFGSYNQIRDGDNVLYRGTSGGAQNAGYRVTPEGNVDRIEFVGGGSEGERGNQYNLNGDAIGDTEFENYLKGDSGTQTNDQEGTTSDPKRGTPAAPAPKGQTPITPGMDASSIPGGVPADQQGAKVKGKSAPGAPAPGAPAAGSPGTGDKAQTSGTVTDGGVAGAENGNNAAITKTSPGVDADGNYTVGKGDTWTDIAQRATGDMNNYQKMYDQNKTVAGPNIDSLAEGTKINIKDFLNDTGNNGVKGDVTNPADGGQDKNPATADAGPAVQTGLGGLSTANGFAAPPKINTPAAPAAQAPAAQAPAAPPASVPAAGSAKPAPAMQPGGSTASLRTAKEWLRWAAEQDGSTSSTSGDGTTNTTAPTTQTVKPGAGTTKSPATPAKPGATTPNSTPEPGGTNSEQQIGPDKQNDTYDPNQGQQPGMGRGNGMPMSNSSGMDALSTGIGAAGDIASGIGNAIPGIAEGVGNAMPDIADAIGGLASGLGSTIFASKQDFDEWVRYAYPTADGEGDLEPHTHPFAGSGWPGPLEIGTSEEYADDARKDMDDVTDLGSGPLAKPLTKWQRQSAKDDEWYDEDFYDDNEAYQNTSKERLEDERAFREQMKREKNASYDEATDDNSDIVRAFRANLDDSALGAGAGGGGRFDDFSGAAQGFLRTAGRNYSLAEQSELIREGDKGGAGNLNSLDLRGTHYEDMNTLGW